MRRLPKICHHKSSGRAFATDPFTGKEHYFGLWGTPEAQVNYEAWIQALIARRAEVASGAPPGSKVTISRLMLDFMAHAQIYYRKDGKETSEIDALKSALSPLNTLFGEQPADGFAPTQLKAVRERMIALGWARRNINKQVQRIRRVFRWGVEHELVRAETLAALATVPGLRVGRNAAREKPPIGPVPTEVLEEVLLRLDPVCRALVEIQLHADMRPGEVCIMRPGDIDQSEVPWLYVPHTHKTKHHGRQRRIFLGPRTRALLAPFLQQCPRPDAWLFPSRARGKHQARRTHWTVSGIRKAIGTACDQDPPLPKFHPSQLRHTGATEIRKAFGIEAAQAVLGHAQLNTSEIYAAKDAELARRVAEEMG